MPQVRCCVPDCAATTRRNPNLFFYALPIPKERRETWMKLIQKDKIDDSGNKWSSSVCSLHFASRDSAFSNNDPTIFPWSPEWRTVIENYNRKLPAESEPQDKQGSLKKQKKGPFPLPVPPPLQQAESVDDGTHAQLPPVLYFRSQHADQWTRFHQKTPVLSCLGGHTEIQGAQEPSISPSSPSICTSRKTNDSPDTTLTSVKRVDGDESNSSSTDNDEDRNVEEEDPTSLLLTGKAHQLMKLLQAYRKNNIISAVSEEQQESPDSIDRKPDCVCRADKKWSADHHSTFSGGNKRRLPLRDQRTITVEGVTYTSVFDSSEENILAQYIMNTSLGLDVIKICKRIYKFCKSCNITAPVEWHKKRAADLGWVQGFLRRHPRICIYFNKQNTEKSCDHDFTYYDECGFEEIRIPVLLRNRSKKKVPHTGTVTDEHNYSIKLI